MRLATAAEPSLRRVVVPAVRPAFTTRRLMVMDFAEGFPIKQLPSLDAAGVDRPALLAVVTAAFAQQVFVDGCFNAGPRPRCVL